METTLLFKTMAILISQLSIVFIGAYSFIFLARRATLKGVKFFGETFEAHYNPKGQLDLLHIPIPEEEKVIKYNEDGKEIDDSIFGTLNSFFTLSLIGLVVATVVDFPIEGKLALFTFHTLSFGPLLGLIMIQIDENDGLKAIILTLLITLLAGFLALYLGIDFSGLLNYLFYPLLALILFSIARIFYTFESSTIRWSAFGGIIIFILFLLVDFSILSSADKSGINDWNSAFIIAFQIYLDIINLLLQILDAMGN